MAQSNHNYQTNQPPNPEVGSGGGGSGYNVANPFYFEEYDGNNDGTIDVVDVAGWVQAGRQDIASYLTQVTMGNQPPPPHAPVDWDGNPPELTYYTVGVHVSGGSPMGTATGQGQYQAETNNVQITATPKPGKQFDGWSGDTDYLYGDTSAPINHLKPLNKSIYLQANFSEMTIDENAQITYDGPYPEYFEEWDISGDETAGGTLEIPVYDQNVGQENGGWDYYGRYWPSGDTEYDLDETTSSGETQVNKFHNLYPGITTIIKLGGAAMWSETAGGWIGSLQHLTPGTQYIFKNEVGNEVININFNDLNISPSLEGGGIGAHSDGTLDIHDVNAWVALGAPHIASHLIQIISGDPMVDYPQNQPVINWDVTLNTSPTYAGTTNFGTNNFAQGAQPVCIAQPNPGYVFDKWTGNNEYLNGSDTDANVSLGGITGPRTLTANFIPDPTLGDNDFAIVLDSTPSWGGYSGVGGQVQGGGIFQEGTENLQVYATSNPGYVFSHWSGSAQSIDLIDGSSEGHNAASSTLKSLDHNVYLTAVFEQSNETKTVLIDVSPAGAGTTIGQGSYISGTNGIQITAFANQGYKFKEWGGSDVAHIAGDMDYNYNMLINLNETINITAVFEPITATGDMEFFEPMFFDEYDLNNNNSLDLLDALEWVDYGRQDIADFITNVSLSQEMPPPYRPPEYFEPFYFEDFDLNGDGIFTHEDTAMWSRAGREDIVNKITNFMMGSAEMPPHNPQGADPVYFEDYDLNNDGALTSVDANTWANGGRPDIAAQIADFITTGNYPPSMYDTNLVFPAGTGIIQMVQILKAAGYTTFNQLDMDSDGIISLADGLAFELEYSDSRLLQLFEHAASTNNMNIFEIYWEGGGTIGSGLYFFEEYDINSDGSLDILDIGLWMEEGRPEVAHEIQAFIDGTQPMPPHQSQEFAGELLTVPPGPSKDIDTEEGHEKVTKTRVKQLKYFSDGNSATLAGSNVYTMSLSASNDAYYYAVTDGHPELGSSDIQFGVTFGHISGSGSYDSAKDTGTGFTKTSTQAVYKQLGSMLLAKPNEGFLISSGSGEIGTDIPKADNWIYAVSFKRKRFGDNLQPGSWTLTLSGSSAFGAKQISLTDNSVSEPLGVDTPAGRRYDIFSGSAGDVYKSPTYNPRGRRFGWFYPDAGMMVFGQWVSAEFIQTAPPVATFRSTNEKNNALWPNLGNTTRNNNNALRFVNMLRKVNGNCMTLYGEKEHTSITYACRIGAQEFNFTSNHSIISGSGKHGQNEPGAMKAFYSGSGDGKVSTMHGDPNSFITGVTLFNASGIPVAHANLSKPIKNNFSREVVIKLRLDL